MDCCRDCFFDRWLREFITRRSSRAGICGRCGNEAPLIDVAELTPYFEPLIDSYAVRPDGFSLATVLQQDWRIFSDATDGVALVRDIFGVGEETLFIAKDVGGGISLDAWAGLKEELVNRNRYFPDSAISLQIVEELVGPQLEKSLAPATYYRARVQSRGQRITLDEMGAPPPGKATGGRANPIGIPYLYLASDEQTAISEVKPQKGAVIALASFVPVDHQPIKVIDLVNPRDSITPFLQPSEVSSLRATTPFIEALDAELSAPVQPADATLDYLASQYICEMFKKSGYHGVRYRSSVGAGANFAFFVPQLFRTDGQLRFVRVSAIDIATEAHGD